MKVAVIGTGNIGKHHTRIYTELPKVELVGIADLDEKTGTRVAEEYHTNYFKDYKVMLEEKKPDIVSVCVPTSYHYEVSKYCILKKIHVLIEKPITNNIPQAKELIDLAKKNRIKLFVGHVERFNPSVLKVKEMIKKGELGKITAIMARRVGGFPPQITDANVAIDIAIHDIDIINYLLEESPKEISFNKQRNHIKNRDDSVEFFLKYKKTSAYIQANWITPVKIRKLNITGSEGYLELDYITQKIEFYKSNYSKFKSASKNFSDYILVFSDPDIINISVAKKEPLKEELSYFISCVEQNIKLDSSYAVAALKIALESKVESYEGKKTKKN